MTTYPTNAEALARAGVEQGVDLGFVDRLICYGESLEPAQQAFIQNAMPNARIINSYSATEVGLIAVPCPHSAGLMHIMADRLGVEVLDDNDQPCAPGEVGKVVITDYWNTASPLLRYEIGDMPEVGYCPCRQIPFPSLARVHGKVRGALMHRNGRRVMFTDPSVAIRDLPGVRQFQVI